MIEGGFLTISISNAHIYDIHLEQAKELISRPIIHKPIELNCPENSFNRAEQGDKDLVAEIFTQLKNQYEPQASLGKMKIVL